MIARISRSYRIVCERHDETEHNLARVFPQGDPLAGFRSFDALRLATAGRLHEALYGVPSLGRQGGGQMKGLGGDAGRSCGMESGAGRRSGLDWIVAPGEVWAVWAWPASRLWPVE